MRELRKADVNSFIMDGVGPQVYASKIDKLEDNGYQVSFGVVFPKLIKNFSDGEEEYLQYIKFDNLKRYDFIFEEKLRPKSEIDRMEIYSRAYRKLYELSLDTEEIVLDSTYKYLSRISFVRTSLNPIYSILSKIYSDNAIQPKQFKINQRKYFDLLEHQELIRKGKYNTYERGNAFIQIEKLLEREKEHDVINYVFGFAIKNGKKYLVDHLKIKTIVPFLRIANTYYSLALKAQELIHTTFEELILEHRRIYNTDLGAQFRTRFEMHLNNVIEEARILEEDKYYYGKENIFKDLQKKAHQVGTLASIGY